jgi:phosphatidylserine/phosphatidylglycerophosphate/cardiolipin synthase-like enzyme
MRRLLLGCLLIVLSLPVLAAEPSGIYSVPQAGPATVCFTSGNRTAPGGDCASLVVNEIGQARRTLLVQAYNFSEPRIIAAIIDARRGGVAVTVILDKTSPRQRGEGADAVSAAGIPVFVDTKPRIAHNKVMVIDGATVITGSFNFTVSAQCCNAENLLVLHSPELASAYAANFMRREAVSVAYRPAGAG